MFSHLSLDNLRGNLFGGLTAGVVALPLALAFGVASGAGPVAGLYGAIMVGFFASLFGGTPAQISGPTGPMTIVFASVFWPDFDKAQLHLALAEYAKRERRFGMTGAQVQTPAQA